MSSARSYHSCSRSCYIVGSERDLPLVRTKVCLQQSCPGPPLCRGSFAPPDLGSVSLFKYVRKSVILHSKISRILLHLFTCVLSLCPPPGVSDMFLCTRKCAWTSCLFRVSWLPFVLSIVVSPPKEINRRLAPASLL